jgi:4-hydroxy-tetrahydrodipicolinate synthase
MVQSFLDGDIKTATKLQLDAIPLISALFSEVNPIPVKAGLNMIGYDFGIPRLPLVELSDKNKEVLRKELEK